MQIPNAVKTTFGFALPVVPLACIILNPKASAGQSPSPEAEQ